MIVSRLGTRKFKNVKSQVDERFGGVAGEEIFFGGRIVLYKRYDEPGRCHGIACELGRRLGARPTRSALSTPMLYCTPNPTQNI